MRPVGAAARIAAAALLAAATGAGAQVGPLTGLSTLQAPPGLAWRRIDAPHFTVLYPDSLEREAQRAATLLERAYEPLTATLRARPARIPVILNTSAMKANGYVSWGPRLSQWYALPLTTVDLTGPVEWYALLALHEGRHVVQQRAVQQGIVGLFARLFGEQTAAFLGGALYFPSWFWEGDAVGAETALSAAGRGRQPGFLQRTRALALAGAPPPFHASWQGSYRTAYPDWYELGYLVTAHVRRTYGDSAWRRVLARASRDVLAPVALSRALRRETGRTLVQLHGDALRTLEATWRAQQDTVRETAAVVHAAGARDYHEFLLPQYAGDGSLVALYGDLGTPRRLVRLRDGRLEVLHATPGLYGELQFHVQGRTVVWSEPAESPRWGEASYLELRTLDLATRRVRRLTARTRYYGPALSPDERRIVAVDFSRTRAAALVVLDARTGAVLQRVPNGSSHHLVTPAWAPDGAAVYVVAVDATRGNALVRVPLDGSAADTLVPFTHAALSRPVARGDWVVFGSPRAGLDNLYALELRTRTTWQVTSRRRGAMWGAPSPQGDRLAFSDYSARGYDVAEMPWEPERFVPATLGEVLDPDPLAAALARQEPGGRVFDGVPLVPWPSRPFRGWGRLADFHSLSVAPTGDGASGGVLLESRNVLNTVALAVGATFDVNERTAALDAGVSYAGRPVILDLAVRTGDRASRYTDSAGVLRPYTWTERALSARLRLPLTRLDGQVRRSLVASAALGHTLIRDQPVRFRLANGNGALTTVTYAVSASQARVAARRDLFPVATVVRGSYRHTPFATDYRGDQLSLAGWAYRPGLWRHHALVLDAAREVQDGESYRFASLVQFPRGYVARAHGTLVRAGATYHLPLWYPDLALGHWLYARRVQGALFGDVGRGTTAGVAERYRSVGGELTADLAPFGLRTTVRTGVRVSRRLTDGRTRTEWVLQLP